MVTSINYLLFLFMLHCFIFLYVGTNSCLTQGTKLYLPPLVSTRCFFPHHVIPRFRMAFIGRGRLSQINQTGFHESSPDPPPANTICLLEKKKQTGSFRDATRENRKRRHMAVLHGLNFDRCRWSGPRLNEREVARRLGRTWLELVFFCFGEVDTNQRRRKPSY